MRREDRERQHERSLVALGEEAVGTVGEEVVLKRALRHIDDPAVVAELVGPHLVLRLDQLREPLVEAGLGLDPEPGAGRDVEHLADPAGPVAVTVERGVEGLVEVHRPEAAVGGFVREDVVVVRVLAAQVGRTGGAAERLDVVVLREGRAVLTQHPPKPRHVLHRVDRLVVGQDLNEVRLLAADRGGEPARLPQLLVAARPRRRWEAGEAALGSRHRHRLGL